MNLANKTLFSLPGYGEPVLIQEFAKTPAELVVHWPHGAFLQMRLGERNVVHFQSICSTPGRDRPDGFYTELCKTLLPRFRDAGVPCVTCEPADEWAAKVLGRRGVWFIIDNEWWIWWIGLPTLPDLDSARNLVKAVQEERDSEPQRA